MLSKRKTLTREKSQDFRLDLALLADPSRLLKNTKKFDEYLSRPEILEELRCSPVLWSLVKEFNTQLIFSYVASLTVDASQALAMIKAEDYLLKPREQVSILAAINKSNQLSGFVRHNILTIEDPACRQIMLERWVMIAMVLHTTGNFFSAQAIYFGLMFPEVSRLFEKETVLVGLTMSACESMRFLARYYGVSVDAANLRSDAIASFKGCRLPTLDIISRKVQGDFTGTIDNLKMIIESLEEQLKQYNTDSSTQQSNKSTMRNLFRRSNGSTISKIVELEKRLAEAQQNLSALEEQKIEYVTDVFAKFYVGFDVQMPANLVSSLMLGIMHSELIHAQEEVNRLRELSVQYLPKGSPINVHGITSLLDDLIVPVPQGYTQGHASLWQIQLIAKLQWLLSPEIVELWGNKLDKYCRLQVDKIHQCIIKGDNDHDAIARKLIALIKPDVAAYAQSDRENKSKVKLFKRLSLSNNPSVNFLLTDVYNALSQGGGVYYRDCMHRLDNFACEIRRSQTSYVSLRASQ